MTPSLGLGGLDDDDDVGSLEVELATGEMDRSPMAAGPVSAAPVSAPSPAGSAGAPSSEPLSAVPTPESAAIIALAGYGSTPPNIVGAVPYAIRVLRRRPQLRRLLAERRARHDQVKVECGGRFASMLDGIGAAEPDDEKIARLRASLQDSHALLEERSAQLQQAQQQVAEQVGAVDEQLSALDQDRAQLDDERRQAQIVLEDCTERRKRAQAQVKRADIQLRALHDVARQAAGKGAKYAPPEHARQIATAEQDRAELGSTYQQAGKAFDEAREALRVHEAALREIDRRAASARSKRAGVERAGSQQEELQAKGVKLAEQQRLQGCEQAIRQLLAERHPALGPELRKEIRALDGRLRASELDLETHRQAEAAYDRASVRNGIIIIAVAAAVVLLVLVMGVKVSSGAGPADTTHGWQERQGPYHQTGSAAGSAPTALFGRRRAQRGSAGPAADLETVLHHG